MQPQKCSLELYSQFLIANHNRYSGLELAKVSPVVGMAHDAVTRWLAERAFTPSNLWGRVQYLVRRKEGYLVGDDTLLDKRYSRENELARQQYSGDEHGIVNGICLVNLLWTSGEEFIPVDYRIYDKPRDSKTKNDHFQEMLKRAKKRGFMPRFTLIDSWYAGIENLKLITHDLGWQFICNLKSNRKVSVTKGAYISIADLSLTDRQVRKVWLKEYGYVRVCKTVATNGDVTYLATSDLALTGYDAFIDHWSHRWQIEEFHRGLKQTTGIEQCSATRSSAQKTHIFAAFTAFLKLEKIRLQERISWYEQKSLIGRGAVSAYLAANA